jgi:hypothetical protein
MKSQEKEKALEMQFEEFKRQTKDLLSKEDDYEKKLEEQEKERFENEQRRMREQTEREEQTAKRILQDMQDIAKRDNSYKVKERAIKNEMKTIMSDVQQQIAQKRERLVNKLNQFQTLRKINETQAANHLLAVKRDIGQQLTASKGNPSQCINRNPTVMESYCTQRVDISMQNECRNVNQFCYICCQNETQNEDDLNCCLNKCDNVMKNSASPCQLFSESYVINSTQIGIIS